MWILFAFGSALFAGLTAILAKCGIRNTDAKDVYKRQIWRYTDGFSESGVFF